MSYLFHVHHWTPEMYFSLGQGGQDLTLALALHEAEEAQERARELEAARRRR